MLDKTKYEEGFDDGAKSIRDKISAIIPSNEQVTLEAIEEFASFDRQKLTSIEALSLLKKASETQLDMIPDEICPCETYEYFPASNIMDLVDAKIHEVSCKWNKIKEAINA